MSDMLSLEANFIIQVRFQVLNASDVDVFTHITIVKT